MKQRNYRTESKAEKMPFQDKYKPVPNSLLAAKSALPFFGGTAPDAPATDPAKKDDAGATTTTATTPTTEPANSGGGDGTALTPEQIAVIVANNAQLQSQLGETNKKLETFTKAESEAAKAKMDVAERAKVEIAERDETIVNMDRVIRAMAVENAIINNKDLKFHSAKHVINEIDPTAYEIDVDLKTGTATVSNLDKELKRVAESNPWMVVDAAKDNPGGKPGSAAAGGNQNPGGAAPRRGSGAPPSPGASRQSDATQRRSDLMKKFPVIARGARTG